MAKWTGPMGGDALIVFVGVQATFQSIFLGMDFATGGRERPTFILMGVAFLAVTSSLVLWLKWLYAPVWCSVRTAVDLDGPVELMASALERAGLRAHREGPLERPFGIRFAETFRLPGGSSVTVLKDPSFVYVGPVGRGDREEVERLKGLVDEAMGGLP